MFAVAKSGVLDVVPAVSQVVLVAVSVTRASRFTFAIGGGARGNFTIQIDTGGDEDGAKDNLIQPV